MKLTRHNFSSGSYFRNFIFGVEDSLVSTVGLLSGIAVGGLDSQAIILSGLVLIAVEALSMGVGSFLSESSATEFISHQPAPAGPAILGAFIMFISYAAAGFIPLFPYFYFIGSKALAISIIVSLFSLFLLGLLSGRLSGLSLWRRGWRMLLLGGAVVLVGTLVGIFVS